MAGPRGILFSEIEAFGRVNDLSRADTIELAFHFEALEAAFFEHVSEMTEAAKKDGV